MPDQPTNLPPESGFKEHRDAIKRLKGVSSVAGKLVGRIEESLKDELLKIELRNLLSEILRMKDDIAALEKSAQAAKREANVEDLKRLLGSKEAQVESFSKEHRDFLKNHNLDVPLETLLEIYQNPRECWWQLWRRRFF